MSGDIVNKMNINEIIEHLNTHGFYKFYQPVQNLLEASKFIDKNCKNTTYSRGANWWPRKSELPCELLDLICGKEYETLFANFGCVMQDICVTKEFKAEEQTRNNYLHFDRLRSLKVLVYLEDVCKGSGPFTICPGTTKTGAKIRRSFASLPYEEKKNRVEIDHPELDYEMVPILGPAGTTIIFDSDTFHKGGSVLQGNTRTVIRSHWYRDGNWRVTS